MKVVWVGNKAELASNKHFNGKFNQADMTKLAIKVIKSATHVGRSDRANPGHSVSKIVWGQVDGVEFAIVMDGDKIKKNIVEIVSFYDVSVQSRETKIERFAMKKISK